MEKWDKRQKETKKWGSIENKAYQKSAWFQQNLATYGLLIDFVYHDLWNRKREKKRYNRRICHSVRDIFDGTWQFIDSRDFWC